MLIGLVLVVIWRKPLSHILSNATRPILPTSWRMCAPRSPSTAAQTPSKFGNAKAMLGIAETGIRFASGEPTVKMSSAPERTWLSMSVEPPSCAVRKDLDIDAAVGRGADRVAGLLRRAC